MHLLIISGPSGSGKSILANKLCNEFKNINIIKTDSYYRDSLIIKLLSIFFNDIYDRVISIKKKELMNTLISIIKKEKNIYTYNYNFRTKKSSIRKIFIKDENNKRIVILEGIFAHRIINHFKNNIFMKILCIEKKELCYERRIKRDVIERGRKTKEVEERFLKSWNIFHKHSSDFKKDNEVIYIDTKDKKHYSNIVFKIKVFNSQT